MKRKEKKIERKEKKAEELERIYLGEEQQEKKILKVKETAKDKVRYIMWIIAEKQNCALTCHSRRS